MSGHSKWATIHRQKEVNDAKRGAAFTKLATLITAAVKQGGGIGDPEKNFRLRLAVEKARQSNMPKDNIQRAIDKATGAGSAAQAEEAMFEGFLPGGAGVLVETLTDNKVRTAQMIRTTLDKGGGTMAGSGAVSYLFIHQGMLRVKPQTSRSKSLEEQALEVIDMGINDIEETNEGWVVFCEKDRTTDLKKKLEDAGYMVESAELVMMPNTLVELVPEAKEKANKLVDQLEELEDVSSVWANYI
ncbi:hypothetical protein A2972_00345 [Candidatus Amesbacteria bacterium RIFCSPLOWO2_01_FULL_47_33]|uniref:Probable transcriptional regulatory protein A2972_00345 n=1 Tax=Candidatus Amesbacteria bacterium RIFCSPLOWO2_01_FULL_47_33 TaxID=1797258 RepID=A0A1F4Z5I2_9BACT|nr:MAG: hypothetical protein A2972_00345 [Candidatus Amesbacteria bacterium RIFCSPLOWO2_01_FULL_47_33]